MHLGRKRNMNTWSFIEVQKKIETFGDAFKLNKE